jgi:stearoyl-CoA desaturase (delta-9 desaturase)
MARYCKEVLSPVVKEELRRANMPGKKLIRRSQKILVREDALLSETARRQRESVLGYSENIHLTYQFKRQLESIWNSGNSEHSLEALRQWCKDAEAAGIQALRDFARQIRGYTVQPVG